MRLMLLLIAILTCGTARSQQIAFTQRTYVRSPVVITGADASKAYGFDSVSLRNDGPDAVTAIHFRLTLRTSSGDEIADERRIPVVLEHQENRKVTVTLGHIEGLRQEARSRKLESGLVILTIEAVEFENGGEWKQTQPSGGLPLDPPSTPPERK